MSGFLRHVRASNGFTGEGYLPLRADGSRIGWLRPAFAAHLARWPDHFSRDDDGWRLCAHPSGFEPRTRLLAEITETLCQDGVISHLHQELYPVVADRRDRPLFLLNRAAAPYFGIRAFGQHLNGFVRGRDGPKLWIARRSADRVNYPDRLDNLVAGGLPYGIALRDNLRKECAEEASIPRELADRARPTGAISYFAESERGCKPDTLYCYDLELPADFTPRCNDGEVESFRLLPVAEVMEIIRETDEFKLNCNLVIIDFCIRHGFIDPDDDEFLALTQGLHRPLLE